MSNASVVEFMSFQHRGQPGRSFGRYVSMLMLLVAVVLLVFSNTARADEDYLDPEVAFKFSATMADPNTVAITYAIADKYYMYRERFSFTAEGAQLGVPDIPPGKVKFDETFQKDVETHRKSVTIRIPVQASGEFTIKAISQGCADKGLCYSPMESEARLSPAAATSINGLGQSTPGGAVSTRTSSFSQAGAFASDNPVQRSQSDIGIIEASLMGGSFLVIIPLFILWGLGLSFTPCVLPMVPILSSIIVGEGQQVRRSRGFALAATYSLGMAVVYTGLGITAGLIGEGLSAQLQNPWVLGTFGLLMVLLALSMFGVYQIQVPAFIQEKLASASERQSRGKLAGVFAMGAISALIVGPCVAAPLAGALMYISQTRDVLIGGGALFAMALGMSIPLLLVGLSAGSLLPRAGAWMQTVKQFFGVLLLAMALWLVSPVLPNVVQMAGWAALGIGYGAYLLTGSRKGWATRAAGIVFAILGSLQLAGLATGGRDPWAPLAHLGTTPQGHVEFRRVKSTAELDSILASTQGKPVMLDFYADWCVSCKEMEKLTFTDPRVQKQFAGMLLLQADVTANDADDKAMLKRFRLFGPPGIIFFDKHGREIPGSRVIGYQNADKFVRSLEVVSTH